MPQWDPKWRFLKRHQTTNEWIVVVMLHPHSMFAHEIFIGDFVECCEVLDGIKIGAY